MTATGLPVSGKSLTTAMPSSSTHSAVRPRAFISAAAAMAPVPPASSSWPLTMITVRFGWKPDAASASSDSKMVTSAPLSSIAPRPQTAPSAMTPAKGGCFQSFSVPSVTGTTSWCAISTMGASDGSDPFQV